MFYFLLQVSPAGRHYT